MHTLSGAVGSASQCLEGDEYWLNLLIYEFAEAWAVDSVGVDLA